MRMKTSSSASNNEEVIEGKKPIVKLVRELKMISTLGSEVTMFSVSLSDSGATHLRHV